MALTTVTPVFIIIFETFLIQCICSIPNSSSMSTVAKNKQKSNVEVHQMSNTNKKQNQLKTKTNEQKNISISNNKTSEVVGNGWWNTPVVSCDPVVTLADDAKWYDEVLTFDSKEATKYKLNRTTVDLMLKQLPIVYKEEVKRYNIKSKNNQDNDQKWIADVIKSGTLSDKIAALTLQVQESPVHHLHTLDILIDLACKKDQQRTSLMTLESLKDLLLHNLLPDRRLVHFNKQPLGHPSLSKLKIALELYYESQLSIRVGRIIDALENSLKSSTSVDFFKKALLVIVCDLLVNKPEQEARLLSILVYKLGDSMPTVAAKAAELLKLVVKRHPAMKLLVVREIKALISDPKLKPKTVFTGAVLLTQLPLASSVLNSNDPDIPVAEELIDCYVGLFEKAVLSDEMGSRLLSILLSGINKAYPCCSTLHSKLNKNGKNVLEQHMDALYKLVHTASFATATQALMLLSHAILQDPVVESTKLDKSGNEKKDKRKNRPQVKDTSAEDRYYRALYGLLLSDQVSSRSKNTLFLNLLFRSIKKDTNIHRIQAFLKRLAICATQSSASITTGLLLLISEIGKSTTVNQQIIEAITESVIDVDCTGYTKTDSEGDESSVISDAGAVDQKFLFDGYNANKRDPAYAIVTTATPIEKNENGHVVVADNETEDSNEAMRAMNENKIGLWELTLLRNHFHPSVQAFSNSLLSRNSDTDTNAKPHEIVFSGDPIVEFSLSGFLNRLSYKNPKKRSHKDNQDRRGDSIPINKEVLPMDADVSSMAPDKIFFHKYFGLRTQLLESGKSRVRSRNRHKQGDVSDESDVDIDDEADFDKYADELANNMLRSNNPDMDDVDEFDDENGDSDSDSGSEGWNDGTESEEGEDHEGDESDNVFAEKVDSEDEDEDSYQLTAFGDDIDVPIEVDEEQEKDRNFGKNKKNKQRTFQKHSATSRKRSRH